MILRERESGGKGGHQMSYDELVPYLVEISHPWLWEQRNLHLADSRQLSSDEKLLLRGYYDGRTVDTVRLATVDHISNPPFYAELKEAGNPVLDIAGAAGIAFIDCIVIRRIFEQDPTSWISILFHELVHVVQFEILGSRRHLELYIRTWAENGYQYHGIQLEAQAHKLEARFNRHEPPFSVREVVERELRGMV